MGMVEGVCVSQMCSCCFQQQPYVWHRIRFDLNLNQLSVAATETLFWENVALSGRNP